MQFLNFVLYRSASEQSINHNWAIAWLFFAVSLEPNELPIRKFNWLLNPWFKSIGTIHIVSTFHKYVLLSLSVLQMKISSITLVITFFALFSLGRANRLPSTVNYKPCVRECLLYLEQCGDYGDSYEHCSLVQGCLKKKYCNKEVFCMDSCNVSGKKWQK